ncbi:yeats family-domain-containing protein [Phlyctochytrium arcticum]|nr:yeats family-domain-containing protein [Phlyctochytrium arcticum]
MTLASRQRLKNISHSRPIIYGSVASLLKTGEKRADPSHTHKWTVFVKGLYNEDITGFIKKVSFRLHDSFENPLRMIEEPPFEVHETGWGEFDIPIKIFVHDDLDGAKFIQLHHTLQLYPKEDAASGPARPVIAENYEEIVFNEPYEEAYNWLMAHPSVIPKKSTKITHDFNPTAEAEEVRKLREANDKVVAQLEKEKARLQAAEEELEALKKVVGED